MILADLEEKFKDVQDRETRWQLYSTFSANINQNIKPLESTAGAEQREC